MRNQPEALQNTIHTGPDSPERRSGNATSSIVETGRVVPNQDDMASKATRYEENSAKSGSSGGSRSSNSSGSKKPNSNGGYSADCSSVSSTSTNAARGDNTAEDGDSNAASSPQKSREMLPSRKHRTKSNESGSAGNNEDDNHDGPSKLSKKNSGNDKSHNSSLGRMRSPIGKLMT